jgi:hypothetical protein
MYDTRDPNTIASIFPFIDDTWQLHLVVVGHTLSSNFWK